VIAYFIGGKQTTGGAAAVRDRPCCWPIAAAGDELLRVSCPSRTPAASSRSLGRCGTLARAAP
jgi:hypothetical protein